MKCFIFFCNDCLLSWQENVCTDVIINGKTALPEPQPSLEDYARLDHPLFTSLNFATIISLQSNVASLESNSQSGRPGLCMHVRQWQSGPVIPPSTGFPFSSSSTTRMATARYPNHHPYDNCTVLRIIHGAEAFLRCCQSFSHSRTSQHFWESESSLPCSQEPSTGRYPQPINPINTIPSYLRSILILLSISTINHYKYTRNWYTKDGAS
jgi:hypothetical protein